MHNCFNKVNKFVATFEAILSRTRFTGHGSDKLALGVEASVVKWDFQSCFFAGLHETLEKYWTNVKRQVISWTHHVLMPGIWVMGWSPTISLSARAVTLRQLFPRSSLTLAFHSLPRRQASPSCNHHMTFIFLKNTTLFKEKTNAIFHSQIAYEKFSYQVITGKCSSLDWFCCPLGNSFSTTCPI